MKIVVVSDTHGNMSFIDKITKMHKDADLFLHAGDSCLDADSLLPFISVAGNCDEYISVFSRIFDVENHRIYLMHGSGAYHTPEELVRICKGNMCDIIIYGHSHIPFYEYYDGVYMLNPGSPIYPRGGHPTYAVMEISGDKLNVEIIKYED